MATPGPGTPVVNRPLIRWLADGRRLHFNHGPIDLVVQAFGAADEVERAYGQAAARFETILEELVAELPDLRTPSAPQPRSFAGPVANRMERATSRHAPTFITPMASVAGAVADEILEALVRGRRLARAYVNNGGDIALHLGEGEAIRAAVAGTESGFADRLEVKSSDPVRGIATSGWRGRSHSLGIADAVTVLASTAAEADAAATLIANAVDLPGHAGITRARAIDLSPDSDLGTRLVTRDVGPLCDSEVAEALECGLRMAGAMREAGLIEAAGLFLRGQSRTSAN